jgi:hypothetical protein
MVFVARANSPWNKAHVTTIDSPAIHTLRIVGDWRYGVVPILLVREIAIQVISSTFLESNWDPRETAHRVHS